MDVEELAVLALVGAENDPLDLCSANIDLQFGIIATTQFGLQVLLFVSFWNR